MPNDKTKAMHPQESSLFITANGLRGKQSVRATFRLPDHIIRLLGLVAAQLGIKQKSLFDQLIEDKEILNKVAGNARSLAQSNGDRRQKTFVLSRRSLDVLDCVARQQNIPRDLLVEISIQRLLPVMNDEQERHAHRKLICQEVESLLEHGETILARTSQLLGQEDQTYALVERIVDLCTATVNELRTTIGKGQQIEELRSANQSDGR